MSGSWHMVGGHNGAISTDSTEDDLSRAVLRRFLCVGGLEDAFGFGD